MRRVWRRSSQTGSLRYLLESALLWGACLTVQVAAQAIGYKGNASMGQQPRVTSRSGKVLQHWVSRFDVWPYLEEFTIDVARELRAECVSSPRCNAVPTVFPLI